ncbi:MAG: carbamoyltransferase HypF [Bryobacteraceae bacterium]
MTIARSVRVRGMVQGVGFRPFVFRLARANSLTGWVLNEPHGVDIHLEGAEPALQAFLNDLEKQAPAAARITAVEVDATEQTGLDNFTIRESQASGRPTVRISPDLPVCDDCLRELFDPAEPRYLYPYINCTNCGPRYTVIESLPYDRANTTMQHWPMDALCSTQYSDPFDRRFHAQPIACPNCGPLFHMEPAEDAPIEATAQLLRGGRIVAIKGIGGYHLACDANNASAVHALRERKYRKEKPFAVMVRNIEIARRIADVSAESEALLISTARPIVLALARIELPGVAPGNSELGLLLPYAPLHHLLFAAGAPEALVMTSANRSSEPIAYEDDDARRQLSGIADAFLTGERPIARRVDDSVARAGVFGPMILRRSRGYAPGAAARLPIERPLLAVGADLKNTVTLAVDGQAFVSQHIGDLDHYSSLQSFEQTIRDLVSMYEVPWDALLVVHDLHPQYASTVHALALPSPEKLAVQHHRAHIASVLAEKEAWERRVIGVSFDGTGYGDDGAIWGGEFFAGNLIEGLRRVMHLRSAALPGGDASARYPVQCAAGFLSQMDGLPALTDPPFRFPRRYQDALQLIDKKIRTFQTTSVGRLYDAAAALLGFTREISFEGQAAMWLEQLARACDNSNAYPFPVDGDTLDFRPLLSAVVQERLLGKEPGAVARAFQRGVAAGLCTAVKALCESHQTSTVVLSGGVFQNEMLLRDTKTILEPAGIRIWTNAAVPPNDGGISLGQAALAVFAPSGVASNA